MQTTDNTTESGRRETVQCHCVCSSSSSLSPLIDYPQTSAEEVWDKSKQDRLAKTITAFQIGYLIVGCIDRAVQSLAITTLELNTLGIVVCSLMTAFAWFHKPADVRHPVRLCSRATMHEISPDRPIQRIPNDRFPMDPYGAQEYCLCFATLLFTGIHVAGYNFSFPSSTERLLWRVSSLVLFGVTAAFWVFETMASWKRLGRWTRLYLKVTDPAKLEELQSQDSSERADSSKKPRELTTLPLPWEFWTIMPIAVLYGLARTFMLLEGLLGLRNVDATAYVTVNWSTYIPHIY